MSYRINWLAASAVCGFLSIAAPLRAGTSPASNLFSIDQAAGDVTFTIDFNHVPDFTDIDTHNRPIDSFQLEVAADASGANPMANLTTIIRGDEIHFANGVRVRNASPPDLTDAQAAGWGTLRGTVPFVVHGTDVSFTTPLALIGAPDGHFAIRAFTVEGGMITSQITTRAVPLPSAWVSGILTLTLVGAWQFKMRTSRA